MPAPAGRARPAQRRREPASISVPCVTSANHVVTGGFPLRLERRHCRRPIPRPYDLRAETAESPEPAGATRRRGPRRPSHLPLKRWRSATEPLPNRTGLASASERHSTRVRVLTANPVEDAMSEDINPTPQDEEDEDLEVVAHSAGEEETPCGTNSCGTHVEEL